MIRVEVTSKAYGETQILRDITFAVEKGETLAILGPSGIGKSTLLGLIAGTDTEFEGRINAPDRRAIVFQEPTLLPWRTVAQNISLIHPVLSKSQIEFSLGRVGILNKADLFPNQLSLGQQRRLALARAFAGDPDLLIMDEPFASLDHGTAQDMLSLTEDLIRESRPATIFVTHSEDEAKRLATRVLRLSGSPATIAPEGGAP